MKKLNKIQDSIALLSTALIFSAIFFLFSHYFGKNTTVINIVQIVFYFIIIIALIDYYCRLWKSSANESFKKKHKLLIILISVLYGILALLLWFFFGKDGLSSIFSITLLILLLGLIPYKNWIKNNTKQKLGRTKLVSTLKRRESSLKTNNNSHKTDMP